jgi:hypothetical protein
MGARAFSNLAFSDKRISTFYESYPFNTGVFLGNFLSAPKAGDREGPAQRIRKSFGNDGKKNVQEQGGQALRN